MSSLRIVVPGKPAAKGRPRMARTGHVFTPKATVTAESTVKACAYEQVGQPMLEGPLEIEMDIFFEIPASWSKKKQALAEIGGIAPTGKPDVDNILKLYTDALNGIVWFDDAQIVRVSARKVYDRAPRVELTVRRA